MQKVRTAVFLFIFVNLVFMAWAHWIDVPLETPVNKADLRLPRLVLASEVSARPVRPVVQAAVAPVTSPQSDTVTPAAAPAMRRCVSVGPFSDLAQETHAVALLQERGFTPQPRTEVGDTRDGFWVYVGGIKSAADETRALRVLQEAGISDAHAMAAADDGRRVSVGLFTERAGAERRARAVQHLGFSPDIVDRHRSGTTYWVDLDLATSDATVSTEGLAPGDKGGSRIQVQSCPQAPPS